MKAILIPNGIIHISESKATCPYCERHIPYEEVGEKLHNSKNTHIRHKCKCKRFVGITSNYMGDLVAYDLKG